MNTERQPDKGVSVKDANERDAKRKRRFARATEAFQKRAEASERSWLAGVRGKPKR